LPFEFEGRNRRARLIFHSHGRLLHGPWLRCELCGAGLMARSSAAQPSSPERTSKLEGTLRSCGSFFGDFLQMLENHAKSGSSPSPHSARLWRARVAPRLRHIPHQ
jgi:hypothetical protein